MPSYRIYSLVSSAAARFEVPNVALQWTSTKSLIAPIAKSKHPPAMASLPQESHLLLRKSESYQKLLYGGTRACSGEISQVRFVTQVRYNHVYSGFGESPRWKSLHSFRSLRNTGSVTDPIFHANRRQLHVGLSNNFVRSLSTSGNFGAHGRIALFLNYPESKEGISVRSSPRSQLAVFKESKLLVPENGYFWGSMSITTSTLLALSSTTPQYSKRRRRWKKPSRASQASPGSVAKDVRPRHGSDKKSVLIVESPAKAKTIQKYLDGKYVVLPSFGHVRDLAAKAGSVLPEESFKMIWEVPSSARPHINAIKAALKGADTLVLASDPDREGEAIAWHVYEILKMEGSIAHTMNVLRVVFSEITKSAVLTAIQTPRNISATLVDAYLARRALDYLIGFDLSPVLWRKLPGSKSAGRVQSSALRLVCERESECEAFVPREYWTVDASAAVMRVDNGSTKVGATFLAKVTHVDGEKLSQFSLSCEEMAQSVVQRLQESRFYVSSIKKSSLKRNPLAPYITSSLQQDASSKLGFGAARTMALAQQLYEGVKLKNDELVGLITYMRTDGVQMSSEAVQSIRALISDRYGSGFVPQKPRQFTSRVKNAQEAHEAIRPTDVHLLPSMLEQALEDDALRLYSLIWRRTVASQMEQATFSQVSVEIKDQEENLQLRASASSVSFPGYLAAVKDTGVLAALKEECFDDNDEDFESEDMKLGSLEAGDVLTLEKVRPLQHFTDPPPRFTEGSLVKRLEELGIGRPSTYASTLKTLALRNYVKIEKRRISPEPRGRLVSSFLSHYFPKFSDYEFTAKLEEQLDEISAGRADWKSVLMDFWPDFHEGVTLVLKIPIEEVVRMLEETFSEQLFSKSEDRKCPSCDDGKLSLKLSRFGAGYFLGCSKYPTCMYRTNVVSLDTAESSDDEGRPVIEPSSKILGVDSNCGLEVFLKNGPFGKYVQLGNGSDKKKPKRAALPKGTDVENLSLADALELLKYPIELGKHPETGDSVLLSVGRFGHFLRCRGLFVSLPKCCLPSGVSPANIKMEEAVGLLKSKHTSKRGRKPQARDDSVENPEVSDKKLQVNADKEPISKLKKVKAPSSPKKSTKASSLENRKAPKKSIAANPDASTEMVGDGNGAVQNSRRRGRPSKKRPDILISDSAAKPIEAVKSVNSR